MPVYNDLRPESEIKERDFALVFPGWNDAERIRAIDNIRILQIALDDNIPPRRTDSNLLVASWNLKEFGHTKQRLNESYFYIAEIISRFDLVAVQEIKSTLKDLNILMRILGDDYAYIINDITETAGGNNERSGYIYNRKRVEFGGLAGEIILWDDLTEGQPITQLRRTPFMTGFKAGWKTFAMINLHLNPNPSADAVKSRATDIEMIIAAIAKKTKDKHLWNENLILVGDFNFYESDDPAELDSPTIKKLNNAGYKQVEGLIGLPTNTVKSDAYDRFFLTDNDYFKLVPNEEGKDNGGTFPVYDYIFKMEDIPTYQVEMVDDYTGGRTLGDDYPFEEYFVGTWRKNQISDHFPIWFELIIDSSPTFLKQKRDTLAGV